MTRRALMLAGGGVKVAFQAGVMQVWLDEAGLEFDLADGASGGCFNTAMWVQGMSGTKMADNWRNLDPLVGIDLNFSEYLKFFYAASLFELNRYREKVFPMWGLDWNAIRASKREATFNVYNFSRHELRIVEPKDMSEDLLVASVSLPMWFPPVKIDGDTYIDSVFNTDCNLEEAIRRGADELWIVWTVSQRGEWFDGFVGNYFGIIEAAANGRYKQILAKIAANNDAIDAGQPGEYGRKIVVKELKAEVPMHYLINFSQDRVNEVVNRGVVEGRAWCVANDIALKQEAIAPVPLEVHNAQTKLQFTEVMKGEVGGVRVSAKMTIKIDGVNRFIVYPDHEASIEGSINYDGSERAIEKGVFNLLVDSGDPTHKKMLYRLFFRDANNVPLTLSGFKDVKDDPGGDVWTDTTTLFTKIFDGHNDDDSGTMRGEGILKLTLLEFLKQLTTFRTEGPTLADRTSALARFGAFFLGSLWDVYARRVLTSGPF